MTTVDVITELFCRIDDEMQALPKHPQANLYPSEIVTLALLFALKGVGPRAFYRWLVRDYHPLFPRLLERTRLFRLFATHQDWTANVHDSAFQPLIVQFAEEMIVLTDANFARAVGNPPNMKVCPRGAWNDRMVVETLFSMLTTGGHCKKMLHRMWRYFTMRLAFTMALFNVLVQWAGLPLDEQGEAHLSIAPFSL